MHFSHCSDHSAGECQGEQGSGRELLLPTEGCILLSMFYKSNMDRKEEDGQISVGAQGQKELKLGLR